MPKGKSSENDESAGKKKSCQISKGNRERSAPGGEADLGEQVPVRSLLAELQDRRVPTIRDAARDK